MLTLKQVQGNVAAGSGLPKQIIYPKVGFVDKKFDSGIPRYDLTKPVSDNRLRRSGYTNNVNVLIDLKGQVFEFPAPLEFQPRPTDVDIAHSVLDRMSATAHEGKGFKPERGPQDEITFLIRQQVKETALANLAEKEKQLLKEGFSPDEILNYTYHDRERIMRRAELPDEMRLRVEAEIFPRDDVGEAGLSLRIGVPSIGQGVRAPGIPALSVPRTGTHTSGFTDSMGRTRPNGVRSQGFVALKAPRTDSSDSYLSSGFSGRTSIGAPASIRGSAASMRSSQPPSDIEARSERSLYGSVYNQAFGPASFAPSFAPSSSYMTAASSRRAASARFSSR